ncbi:flagellar hook assembly protein FlgD [Salicibibacter cibi]|uniref:Flagellar hook assembly protein FlgD n=1 Tax=Salicibibacter cibi TaxID=2743001 RepID=A0A7T7CFQ8_9BACI|nr:flagellar hook assembly protein FlgD [Salicibibacter cibi]QQK80249.1 flagellar hook assembly protein FlgD [Salicibibacter cibi]
MNMNVQATASPGERDMNEGQVAEQEDAMLDKDDFLKILIAQLQNQDPLDPMDDREFIAQMAQFSSLEQMTNMNEAMQRFVDRQEGNALVQQSELIGTTVKWGSLVDEDHGEIQYKENEVQSVRRSEQGDIELLLDDGRWIDSRQVAQIGLEHENEET